MGLTGGKGGNKSREREKLAGGEGVYKGECMHGENQVNWLPLLSSVIDVQKNKREEEGKRGHTTDQTVSKTHLGKDRKKEKSGFLLIGTVKSRLRKTGKRGTDSGVPGTAGSGMRDLPIKGKTAYAL